jgi:glycerate 2-kinase
MLDTPPTVLVVPDSFKGCLPAADVAAAMAQGVELALGDNSTIIQLPFADGGEGTLDALTAHWAVAPRQINTVDAVGRPRIARYGISTDSTTGIIEAAEANGLPHVADLPPQPMRADSFGVGIIARELLDRGVDEILLCIGGSASTDGGTGILRALGASFLDSAGNEVPPGGGGLAHVYEIDDTKLHPRARQVMWRIATDVDNPLCGKHGAAEVFGPQKGASPSEVAVLDAGLAQLAKVLDEKTGMDVKQPRGYGCGGRGPRLPCPAGRRGNGARRRPGRRRGGPAGPSRTCRSDSDGGRCI